MFYTYILKNPLKNDLPFYVGKGKGTRVSFQIKSAISGWRESKEVNPHKSNTIKQIIDQGNQVNIEFFYFDTEYLALEKEQELIKHFGLVIDGSGILLNLTYGGEGYSRPGIQVNKYTMQGDFIQTYNSIQEASLDITGNNNSKNSIKECCDGLRRSCKGYKWSYKNSTIKVTEANNIRGVRQYYPNGNFVAFYTSLSKAAIALGKKDSSTIAAACRNNKLAYGFKWIREV